MDYTADEAGYKPVMTIESAPEAEIQPEPILKPIAEPSGNIKKDESELKPIIQHSDSPKPIAQQDSKPEPQPVPEMIAQPYASDSQVTNFELGDLEQVIEDDAVVINIPVAAPAVVNEPVEIITPENVPRPDEIYTDDAVIIDAILAAVDAQEDVSQNESGAVKVVEGDQGDGSDFINTLLRQVMEELSQRQAAEREAEYRKQLEEAGLIGEEEDNPAYQTGELSPIEIDDGSIAAEDYEKLAAAQYYGQIGHQVDSPSALAQVANPANKELNYSEDEAYVQQVYEYLQQLRRYKEGQRRKQGNFQDDIYEVHGQPIDEQEYWRILMEYYLEEKYRQEMIAQHKHNSKFDSGNDETELRQQAGIPQDSFLHTSCRRILAMVQQQLQQQFLNSLTPPAVSPST